MKQCYDDKTHESYCGTKTGSNMRIDWDTEILCLPGSLYFDKNVRCSVKY